MVLVEAKSTTGHVYTKYGNEHTSGREMLPQLCVRWGILAVCFYYGLNYVRWFDLSGLLILVSEVFQSEPFEINGAGVLSLVLRYLLTLHSGEEISVLSTTIGVSYMTEMNCLITCR